MKFNLNTNLILALLFLLLQNSMEAQDKKIRVHALSLGPGIASTSTTGSATGWGVNFDFSTIANGHIISLNTNTGINIPAEPRDEAFVEINLTYGRKWNIGQYLVLEGHLGIGIFTFDEENDPNAQFNIDIPAATVGFPFRVKFLYYPAEKLGVGLNPNLNLNSGLTAYTVNFLLQYNFN